MFGSLGGPEVVLILVIALIVFGPRRLPDIGKSMGKMLAEFRKASNDFKRTIEEEVEADKIRASIESRPEPPAASPPTPADTPATPTPAPEAAPAVPAEAVSRDPVAVGAEPVEPK